MLALHKPEQVFSPRHAPSWLLLAFGAGSVNAIAFLSAQTFVSHVTGTATRLGLNAGRWLIELEYLTVLLCFIFGAMTSVLAIDGRYYRGKKPYYSVPLLLVVGLLVGVAMLGRIGAFGEFGGEIERPAEFAMLYLLSFAMGLQNAAVATSTGMTVRTTHLTGTATDLGVHLATVIFARGEVRHSAIRSAMLRGGKLIAFTLGGMLMLPVASHLGFLSFLVPAASVGLGTLLSFIPVSSYRTMEELS